MDNLKRDQNILKAVLLLRRTNRYTSKEEQIAEVNSWFAAGFTDSDLLNWISALKEPDPRDDWTQEQWDAYYDDLAMADYEFERNQYTCCTNRDYSPSNPWDAPGMSIRDFI